MSDKNPRLLSSARLRNRPCTQPLLFAGSCFYIRHRNQSFPVILQSSIMRITAALIVHESGKES